MNETFTRLSSKVTPINYELRINPNLETFEFHGTVIIDLKVTNFQFD
jgi:hypothetical protein